MIFTQQNIHNIRNYKKKKRASWIYQPVEAHLAGRLGSPAVSESTWTMNNRRRVTSLALGGPCPFLKFLFYPHRVTNSPVVERTVPLTALRIPFIPFLDISLHRVLPTCERRTWNRERHVLLGHQLFAIPSGQAIFVFFVDVQCSKPFSLSFN